MTLAFVCNGDTGRELTAVAGVQLTSSKDVYRIGEPIEFRIQNEFREAIRFTVGCERPLIELLSGGDSLLLTTETDDSVPQSTRLAPGEARLCRWDQRAWQAPGRKGSERFRHFAELAPVPPGQYRLRLDFHGAGEDFETMPPTRTIHSPVFTIR